MGKTLSTQNVFIPQSTGGIDERLRHLMMALATNHNGMLTATRQRLIRIAQMRGIAPDAIEDVVQETFLEAWKHLDRLHTPEGFPYWIDEICRNICRRTIQKQQTNSLRFVPLRSAFAHSDEETRDNEGSIANIETLADAHAPDAFDTLSRQDLLVLLDRALNILPGNARSIVEACDLLELPHREAAARLGLSVSALETRLHRVHRTLRHLLNGPLRAEAESLGLHIEPLSVAQWYETRLWCSLCGRRKLQGMFLPSQPEGSQNLHLRCPDCAQRYGLDTVHSMGLVQLDDLRSFRPAWKRTMQEFTSLVTSALARGWHACPRCGTQANMQIVDNHEATTPSSHPFQFSIKWHCSHCDRQLCSTGELPAVSEVVCWSHPQTRQFLLQYPQIRRMPEKLVEYEGQPALCVQMSDATSTTSMTVLAHRQTLAILAIL